MGVNSSTQGYLPFCNDFFAIWDASTHSGSLDVRFLASRTRLSPASNGTVLAPKCPFRCGSDKAGGGDNVIKYDVVAGAELSAS